MQTFDDRKATEPLTVEIDDNIFDDTDDIYDGTDDIDDFDKFEKANGLNSAEPSIDQETGAAAFEYDDDHDGRISALPLDDDLSPGNNQGLAGDSFIEIYNDIEPAPLQSETAKLGRPDHQKTDQLPFQKKAIASLPLEKIPPAEPDKTKKCHADLKPRQIPLLEKTAIARPAWNQDAPRLNEHFQTQRGAARDLAPTPVIAEAEARAEKAYPSVGVVASGPAPDLALPAGQAAVASLPLSPQADMQGSTMPLPGILPTLMIAEVPCLRRFAAAILGDEDAADQLVQATFQQALLDPVELPADRDLSVSLLAILYRRRREALKQLGRPLASTITRSFDGVLFQRLPGADRDEIREFADTIGSLGEEDRSVLLLIALENLNYRDVAQVTMMPMGRVMSKIASARIQLHQALKTSAAKAQGKQNPDHRVWKPAELRSIDVDLHGYLDGELSKDRIDAVEDYLDQERVAAERLIHYGVQGDLIRRLYGPLINRPLPPLLADQLQAATRQKQMGPAKGRKKLVFSFLLLVIFILGAGLWFFKPALLERIPAMLDALPIDRFFTFFETARG